LHRYKTMGAVKKNKDGSDEIFKASREVQKSYVKRFEHVTKGREALRNNKFAIAIENYRKYLQCLIDFKNVPIRTLSPKNFDKEKDISELLIISHVFWDLAIIYDRSPSCKDEFGYCLLQFTRFSIGFKYQSANLVTIRRYIYNKDVKNKVLFEQAFQKILKESKKCYIATHCFGELHPNTMRLRVFKRQLLSTRLGAKFVFLYYIYSPKLVIYMENHPKVNFIIRNLISRPALASFSKLFPLN
jgi:hypothetical protein